LKIVVSRAVAAIPENLPAVATATLSFDTNQKENQMLLKLI
jgi:magnesium-transporting ATPase (P-type)